MGCLSKIFKGSIHKVSKGRYDWRYAADNDAALSPSEEDQKGNHLNDSVPRVEEDAVLARSFHERMNAASSTGSGNYSYNGSGSDNLYQPITLPYSSSLRICAGCNADIGHGRSLSCMNAVWHPECFRCRGCNQPISDSEVSVSTNYPYHKACYKESHYPKCDVCKHFLPTNAAGMIEYRVHPFWSQKYCSGHEHDGTPRCCSCERLESWNARFTALNDGRNLCSECLDSAIMGADQCQPLLLDIHKFFEGLNMKLTQKVPLLLVDMQSLNESIGADYAESHGHNHMPETRGICLSEEQTITKTSKQSKRGKSRRGTGNRITNLRILILYGLPRILTGTILAHETMHAWLRLNGYGTLREEVEEGICQVIASMWLESQILSISDTNNPSSSSLKSSKMGKRSPSDMKLCEFFKQHIATDDSEVYGHGFRVANRVVLKFGLAKTLKHLRKTGNFPG